MKIAFAAPMTGSWATAQGLTRIAQRAERLGYHSLWTYQRLFAPLGESREEGAHCVLDPVVAMTHLAAHTSSIRIGAAVLNMPYAAPPVLAKQLATLDLFSGGRLDVGLGLGAETEYAAVGADTRGRGRRAEEFVSVLKNLWTAEVAEHHGEFYTVPACHFGPKPVQRPHPPLLLGARALPALRRAGRIADGWIASRSSDPATLGELLATVRGAAEDAGRDPDSLRYVCRASVQVRPSGGAPFCGPAEKIRDDLARLAELGFTEAFVDLNFDPEIASVDIDAEAALDRAEGILEELAPA